MCAPGFHRKNSPCPPLSWREQTHRQDLLLTLLCHTRPPSFHCLLLKKGHKPFWVEGVIQLVQGALLSCLGWLGHSVEIQLQGACGRVMLLEDAADTVHLGPFWVGRFKSSLPPLQLVLMGQPRVSSGSLPAPFYCLLLPLYSVYHSSIHKCVIYPFCFLTLSTEAHFCSTNLHTPIHSLS